MKTESQNSELWHKWATRTRKKIKQLKIEWINQSNNYRAKNLDKMNHILYIDNQLEHFLLYELKSADLSSIQWVNISLLREQFSDLLASISVETQVEDYEKRFYQ